MGLKCSRGELTHIMGVSNDIMSKYIAAGMPQEVQGSRGIASVFDTAAVFRWFLTYRDDPGPRDVAEVARGRLAEANATRAEMEVLERRGQLVDPNELLAPIQERLSNVRSRIVAIPGRCAIQIDPEHPARVERIIKHEIAGAMEMLNA